MEPVRYIMEGRHIAACFAAAGEMPPATDYYAALPDPAKSPPQNVLTEDGALIAEARCLFEAMAQPCQAILFRNFAPGSDIIVETRIVRHENRQCFAVIARDNDIWDVALLTSPDQVLAILDDLGGLSSGPPIEGDFAIELTLPALAVLSALARLVQLADNVDGHDSEAVLEILTGPVRTQYVLAALLREAGLLDIHSPIARMAVASDGLMLSDVCTKTVVHGIDDCKACGLIDDDDALTGDGQAVITILNASSSQSMVSFTTSIDDQLVLDDVLLLHMHETVLTGAWKRNSEGAKSELVFTSSDGCGTLDLCNELLSLGAVSEAPKHEVEVKRLGGFCQHCGNEQKGTNRFCTSCGEER